MLGFGGILTLHLPPHTSSPGLSFLRQLLIPSTFPLPSRHIQGPWTAGPSDSPATTASWLWIRPFPQASLEHQRQNLEFAESSCPWNLWKRTCRGFSVSFSSMRRLLPSSDCQLSEDHSFSLLFGHLVQGKLVTLHSFEAASFIYTACSSLARWSLPALVYSTTPPTDCRVSFLPSVLLGWIPLHSSSPEQWSAQHMASALLPGRCHAHKAAAKLSRLLIFYAMQPRCGGQFIGTQNKDLKEKTNPASTLRCKLCFQSFSVASI